MEEAGELRKTVGIAKKRELMIISLNFPVEGVQRIVCAAAACRSPELLIADIKPTTALDVTIQAQILELMKKNFQKQYDTSLLMIT